MWGKKFTVYTIPTYSRLVILAKITLVLILQRTRTRYHAIAGTTARCALYMSAQKIVCKGKISRRLRKNRHITILSLFGGEIIFEVFPSNAIRVAKRYRRYTVASPRGETRQTKCRRYYRYRRRRQRVVVEDRSVTPE